MAFYLSPSKLDRAAACPRYVQTDFVETDDSANEGLELHKVLEQVRKEKRTIESFNLDPEQENAVRFANESVENFRSMGFANEEHEVEISCSLFRRGYIDVLLHDDRWTEACAPDYKMGRLEGSYVLQLKSYAAALFELHSTLQRVVTAIIQPRLKEVITAEYTRDQLPALIAEITAVQKRAENPFVEPTICEYCSTCKWQGGGCPAQNSALVPVSQAIGMPVTKHSLQNPQTPEDWSRILLLGNWICDYFDGDNGVKRKATALAVAGTTIPGYKLIQKMGASSIKKEEMVTAFDRLKGMGIDETEIQGACTLSISRLVKARAELSGSSEDEVKTIIVGAVKDLMTQGAPIQYLARSSRKPVEETFAQLSE